ncbi:MAG: hypothetical protein SGI94_16295 [Saprospiraceae bacterium]|nr:hypothetical protein [Saprospiraceae bacterium]
MSKDKGIKNIKKAPADRSLGKGKAVSAYKSESKSGQGKQSAIETSASKPALKAGKP